MMKYAFLLLAVGLVVACEQENKIQVSKKESVVLNDSAMVEKVAVIEEEQDSVQPLKSLTELESLADTSFVRLADYSNDFAFDMRYATDNNFLKTTVYDCAECYTRAKTAKQLLKANTAFLTQGYRIKFFDCYRPLDVQKRMWKLVPNPMYVADPSKGSIHNRGGAVDITLVDMEGKELPMGTGFDFFGQKAHHTYKDLPAEVLEHRKLLKTTMEKYGFNAIESEWWHYNLGAMTGSKVANFVWDCE